MAIIQSRFQSIHTDSRHARVLTLHLRSFEMIYCVENWKISTTRHLEWNVTKQRTTTTIIRVIAFESNCLG